MVIKNQNQVRCTHLKYTLISKKSSNFRYFADDEQRDKETSALILILPLNSQFSNIPLQNSFLLDVSSLAVT